MRADLLLALGMWLAVAPASADLLPLCNTPVEGAEHYETQVDDGPWERHPNHYYLLDVPHQATVTVCAVRGEERACDEWHYDRAWSNWVSCRQGWGRFCWMARPEPEPPGCET